MSRNTLVLVIADNADSLERTVNAVKAKNLDITKTTDMKSAVLEFVKHQPPIVIMSFDKVVEAEKLLFLMVKTALQGKPFRYQTILLCSGKESKLAYELCMKNVFDDYVIDKPLYDTYQIQLIIGRAIERRKKNSGGATKNDTGGGANADTANVLNMLKDTIEQGIRSGANAKTQLAELRETLGSYVGKVSADFMSQKYNGILRVLDEQKLKQNLELFKRENVDSAIAKVEENIVKSVDGVVASLNKERAKIEEAARNRNVLENARPKTVLMVEDDQVYQDIVKRTLETANYEVTACTSGMQVLGLLNSGKVFDFVFMDHELPEVTGAEIIKWLRAFPQLEKTPVVMLTGHSDKQTLQQCLAAGATDFVKKPANRKIILEKIQQHLAKSGLPPS